MTLLPAPAPLLPFAPFPVCPLQVVQAFEEQALALQDKVRAAPQDFKYKASTLKYLDEVRTWTGCDVLAL